MHGHTNVKFVGYGVYTSVTGACETHYTIPYHNCIYSRLPEDKPSGSKHVDGIKILKIKILIWEMYFNPLNAELNPICHLLALLGAHHFLHVSRIRVNIHGSLHRSMTQ